MSAAMERYTPYEQRVTLFGQILCRRRRVCIEIIVRLAIAVAVETLFELFMVTVVMPALLATGIGVLAEGLAATYEMAFAPAINSMVFIVFDDRFLYICLEDTGVMAKLESRYGKMRRKGLLEGMLIRYVLKSGTDIALGIFGLTTIIPLVGNFIVALATGWLVTWDYVYVALCGIRLKGPLQQARAVWADFGSYFWWGTTAVLLEELPFVGPLFHVFNIYSAVFFLEAMYYAKRLDPSLVQPLVDGEDPDPEPPQHYISLL